MLVISNGLSFMPHNPLVRWVFSLVLQRKQKHIFWASLVVFKYVWFRVKWTQMTILQAHGSPSVSSYVLSEPVKLNHQRNNTGQDRLKEVEDTIHLPCNTWNSLNTMDWARNQHPVCAFTSSSKCLVCKYSLLASIGTFWLLMLSYIHSVILKMLLTA